MVASLVSNRASASKNVEKSKGGRPKKDKDTGKGKSNPGEKKNNGKSPEKKREWKATALRKGWLSFRADYVKKHGSSGKTVQELNKAAGEACLAQLMHAMSVLVWNSPICTPVAINPINR